MRKTDKMETGAGFLQRAGSRTARLSHSCL